MAVQAEVQRFWEAETCGTRYASAAPGTPQYYREIESTRYRLEPFIPDFAQFGRWRDRRVLEIGIGAGTDFVNFVRAGARADGVDLTASAVEHVQRRLALEGLQASVQQASAETLPFDDGTFDLVYSWGVVHHAERPAQIVREARRVLAPGGEARMMLYGRHSWVAYALWARHGLLTGHPGRSLTDVVAKHMESPGTQAYTRRELQELFAGAGFEEVSVTSFPTPYDRRVAGPLARVVRQDWFLGVTAR